MKSITYLTLIALIGLTSFGFSQSAFDAIRIVQDEMGFGARALGMGGAYTCVANDYSAIYWNPAGLADVKYSEFFGELSHLNFQNEATFANTLTDDSENYTHLRSLGLAIPLPTSRGSFVIGIGYNRVKDYDQNLFFTGYNNISNDLGFNLEDQQGNTDTYYFDRNVQQTEQIIDEGGLNQWSFGAAIALSPNFTAGLTANIYRGKDEYLFTFTQEDIDNNYNVFPGDFDMYQLNQTLITDYSAFNLKFGGMFKVNRNVKIGAAIGLPTTFSLHETFNENDLLVFDDGFEDPVDYGTAEFDYDVKTPMHFDGGISFSNQNITLAASMRYRDWSQTKFDIPDNQLNDPDYRYLLDLNPIIRQDYRATLQYNLGGEIYLQGLNSKLRGGYSVYPSPLENALSDMDKKFISAGIGFKVDRNVNLDVTYLRGSWKQESEDSYTPGGTLEDITLNKFFIGLSYNF
jgi:long-subunit fatty acid transport protein